MSLLRSTRAGLSTEREADPVDGVPIPAGAGISTAASIPDFRSSGGLFATLKERFPEARLTSGKDLFDVAAWKVISLAQLHLEQLTHRNGAQDPATLALHLGMLGELHTQCEDAEPTAFHRLLKRLDDEGKLSRVYTCAGFSLSCKRDPDAIFNFTVRTSMAWRGKPVFRTGCRPKK